jgi:hypothetical protein
VKIVTPQGLLYPGETVTLQCDISGYKDWTYRWFRDNHHLPSQTSKAIDITIPITQTGQVCQYRCEGLRTDRPQRSQPSDVVTISVTGKFTIVSITITGQFETALVMYPVWNAVVSVSTEDRLFLLARHFSTRRSHSVRWCELPYCSRCCS